MHCMWMQNRARRILHLLILILVTQNNIRFDTVFFVVVFVNHGFSLMRFFSVFNLMLACLAFAMHMIRFPNRPRSNRLIGSVLGDGRDSVFLQQPKSNGFSLLSDCDGNRLFAFAGLGF